MGFSSKALVAFAIVISVGFMALFVSGVVRARSDVNQRDSDRSTGEAAFREANSAIISKRNGIHQGNNDEARQLARKFSNKMVLIRNAYYTQGDADDFSVSGGEFITYCEARDGGHAFLIHVPQLRKFTEDAKSSLADFAWLAAWTTLEEADLPPGQLAIGVKGAAFYSEILVGTFDASIEDPDTGVVLREPGMTGTKLLQPFFEPAE